MTCSTCSVAPKRRASDTAYSVAFRLGSLKSTGNSRFRSSIMFSKSQPDCALSLASHDPCVNISCGEPLGNQTRNRLTGRDIMQTWPIGVFTSVDAGLGVRLDVAQELGVPTVQIHSPHKQTRTQKTADEFL